MRCHRKQSLVIPLGNVTLRGDLAVPHDAKGLVVFANDSGNGRHCPRHLFVAERLQRGHLATLLTDLLTEEEDQVRANRFEVDLLARRLVEVTHWAQQHVLMARLPVGYLGAGAGAAAALRAAAELGSDVRAVVSRGGRPDLAMDVLSLVSSPALLIVGGHDFDVLDLNRRAYERLTAVKSLEVIPGATHLFEEAGALPKVTDLAAAWFLHHLPQAHELAGVSRAAPGVAKVENNLTVSL